MKQENFESNIVELCALNQKICSAKAPQEKLKLLDQLPKVQKFFTKKSSEALLKGLSDEQKYVIKAFVAIDQARGFSSLLKVPSEKFKSFLEQLQTIDQFYSQIGGIIGYQFQVSSLLVSQKKTQPPPKSNFRPPFFTDMSKENALVRKAVLWGILHMPMMAEIYPIGGAADRLHLQDEKTKEALPAARLLMGGKTLLEHLVLNVQAREYLYFKLFEKQLSTPIVMMSSSEKKNHRHILSICEKKNWFHRGEDNFFIFEQPCVPAIDEQGSWVANDSGDLYLKPGGHGAVWKLAREKGAFEWLRKKNRKKALIRQINNPIAGIDYGLLAFAGWGSHYNMEFGFSSCPRQLHSAEGMNVLVEKRNTDGYQYVLSNIEYCNFHEYGIEDQPVEEGQNYSRFSSNTNILFADLYGVEQASLECPFPGSLLNFKKVGNKKIGRMESTMQNIADVFYEAHPSSLGESSALKQTYITYNQRHKTISTAKKVLSDRTEGLESPERCFFDLQKNAYELLKNHCGFQMPLQDCFAGYLDQGPSFVFLYHPALGPLYSLIQEKVLKGKFAKHAELQLDIAEVFLEGLDLDGSLIIEADNIMGGCDSSGKLVYSTQTGKCQLKNVKISNQGIDRKNMSCSDYWKAQMTRKQKVHILLHGNGEFIAENITLHGDHFFEVEDGTSLCVYEEGGLIKQRISKISEPSWYWEYDLDTSGKIAGHLRKISCD